MHAFGFFLTYDLLEDRHIDDIIIKTFFNSLLYKTNRFQDHRGRQNVVRTSVTHSAMPRVPLFCSYHILTSSVIYHSELTWNLFVKWTTTASGLFVSELWNNKIPLRRVRLIFPIWTWLLIQNHDQTFHKMSQIQY